VGENIPLLAQCGGQNREANVGCLTAKECVDAASFRTLFRR
jgi:hypothetical protein